MVLPIIIGVGATAAALTAKTLFSAYRKYAFLTPEMIASLNNIKVENHWNSVDHSHPHSSHHYYIRQHFENAGFGQKMTEQEALQILGITGDNIAHVNSQMVKDRYRKLMVANHPDKNGSQYLSQKINEAKAVLDRSPLTRK